jgi:hypothetical protein
MKHMIALMAATTALGLASSAYAADPSMETNAEIEYKNNGGYESTRDSKSVDAQGTKVTSESDVDVDVDSQGNITKTLKSETVTDPRGLMNKQTDNGKTVFEEKANGGYVQTTTRSHVNKDGTNVTYRTVTDVDVQANGNVATTARTDKTVDPKGLFNSKTTSSMTKSINGQMVEQDKKVD